MDTIEIDGTPIAVRDIFSQMGQKVGDSFSVIWSIQALMRELGTVGSFMTFAFMGLMLVIIIKLGSTFVPIILMLGRLILQFIQTIKPI